MVTGVVEALLLETYGTRLLAYLSGVDTDAIHRRLEDGEQLSRPAEEAIARFLVPLAESVARQRAAHPGLPVAFSLHALGGYDRSSETSVANMIRASAGGPLPAAALGTEADADPVKSALFRLARDGYAQLLATNDDGWFMPPMSLFEHPVREELDAAVMQDPALAHLYPEDDPGLGRRGLLYNSLGGGATIQSVMFGETVIASAWAVATMIVQEPSLEDLLRAIDTNVDTIREAVNGGHPLVPARLVFTGIAAAAGAAVDTPWGILRTMNDMERRASPSSLEGAVSGTDHEGKSVTVSYAGELVLDAWVPYGVVVRPWSDIHKDDRGFPSATGATDLLRRAADGLRLAVFLAVERPPGSWATARLAWQWAADPLSSSPAIAWNDVRSQPGFMPYELSAEDCEELAAWASRVEDHWKPAIDIAIRRVLSAAHVRTDAPDRLVDTVIAWENLFGTSEGEPRLRVSTAMAWLLEVDASCRITRQDQLKRLYDLRSKIVHGAKFDEQQLSEKANDALSVARSILQLLFRDRPDLLALPGGAARSLNLILDA